MTASRIDAVSSELRSLFLEGVTPLERTAILAAATKRQFFANAVITDQGHSANHFFLLTRVLVRYFIITEEGRKLLLKWLGPGDLFGGRTVGDTVEIADQQDAQQEFRIDRGAARIAVGVLQLLTNEIEADVSVNETK